MQVLPMQSMEFIYLYRSIGVCVTVLRLCTSASLLSVQLHVHLCVCEVVRFPPPVGPGCSAPLLGRGPFPVPGSWFPSSRRRGITWPWGTTSPWPGRSRCSAPLKVCSTYETVPCRALGMVLRYVDGRVFVTKVLPESQAEVDEVVLAGDVLDGINGCSLRYASPGQAVAVLQRLKGQPLTFRLLQWQWHDGTVFEPLLPYLKALKEKEPHFQLQHSPRHRGERQPWQLQGGRWVCAMGSPQARLRALALG
ncbi:uncharacterized protein LOC132336864 isoform X4 [Haemorhous mexicanus]|uniref:uncharacterized protein LOC132336864 isoform X4 n=2 Tax=Haemorhous mexicanus TaxID=30427 RepID=UPI0028BD6281|nr:uncharacterized protein LOC132336864 isoform X4 [Haemorhous mexicanus]